MTRTPPAPCNQTLAQAAVLVIALAAAMVLLTGCAGASRTAGAREAGDAIGAVGTAFGRIAASADTIIRNSSYLPDSGPKVEIIAQAASIKADGVRGDADRELANRNMKEMSGTINNLTTDNLIKDVNYLNMKKSYDLVISTMNEAYIGPALVRAWHWFLLGLFAIGGIAIVTGFVWPTGWGMIVSRFITTWFPFMTPFMWIRDLLLRVHGIRANVVMPTK